MTALHAVIVLAAGRSQRLGRDKASLLRADGSSFLQHVVSAALSTQPLCVLVVRRAGQSLPMPETLQARIQRLDCADAAEGMAASLRCGLRALPAAAQAALLLLLDQPALQQGHLQALVQTWQSTPLQAVASAYGGVVAAPAILPRCAFAALLAQHGDVGARDWLRASSNVRTVAAPELAQDVDWPLDWMH
jgi:CTP:molybdopterin cytidylyltransferase MocA